MQTITLHDSKATQSKLTEMIAAFERQPQALTYTVPAASIDLAPGERYAGLVLAVLALALLLAALGWWWTHRRPALPPEPVSQAPAGVLHVTGVWSAAKLSTDVVTQGAALYWDNTNSRFTLTSAGNTLAGWAFAAAGNGVTTVQIKLLG